LAINDLICEEKMMSKSGNPDMDTDEKRMIFETVSYWLNSRMIAPDGRFQQFT
jgi:hypothetical protein